LWTASLPDDGRMILLSIAAWSFGFEFWCHICVFGV
jgi:hypothetical protein